MLPQLVLEQQYFACLNNKNLFLRHVTPFASKLLRDQINRKYYNSINKSHYGKHKFCVRAGKSNELKAVATSTSTTSSSATPVVAPKWNKNFTLSVKLDVERSTWVTFGTINVELVAAEKEKGPDGTVEKTPLKDATRGNRCTFKVPPEFGDIGAVILYHDMWKEMYVKEIKLEGFPDGSSITIHCNSWVQPNSIRRVFFTNKSYLPSQTPSGLIKYREMDLSAIRGDGKGKRKEGDRIYDYDVYNDLGNPGNEDLKRIALGGSTNPYPRRCRTGRPPYREDKHSESRIDAKEIYVPRDERFSKIKQSLFDSERRNGVLNAIDDFLLEDFELGFPCFTEIDQLFNEFGDLPEDYVNTTKNLRSRIFDVFQKFQKKLLCFETPELLDRDKFAWMKDEEFGRQTLAGVNPCSIQLVKEWPLKSNLDPAVYGEPESAITREMVELMMSGSMKIEEAIKQKRLFVIDYYDLVLPFVEKVRKLEGRNLYGTRALFFRTPMDTLKPIAIELGTPKWKKAYMPSSHGTPGCLWMLAKAQFLAVESGYHQLVSHWLRTHCVVEPYVIATNRQLSAMHPIYRLLKTHFKDTLAINALARGSLVNAGGVIESAFSPGKCSMEMSSVAYREMWRFDQEGLPTDLIRRGMAEEDQTPGSTGVKLTIEDYPYASDGIRFWTIIKDWVKAYVSHYYPDAIHLKSDNELSNWWTEIRTVGHADKKDEPWWPKLQTTEDLVGILTTMIWITSGHHAAVNFGQYDFAAYFPNRPTIARTKMPDEDPIDKSGWEKFIFRPEDALLSCYPTLGQANTVVITLDLLSNHSEDEEYIGQKPEPSWAENNVIMKEFELFKSRLKKLEKTIDKENMEMGNRSGAGVVPYTFLKASSEKDGKKIHGITRMGVPNSVSI